MHNDEWFNVAPQKDAIICNVGDTLLKMTDGRVKVNQLNYLIFSISLKKHSSGKKSKSVFDFFTYSRETGFSFSYAKVECLDRPNVASDEIDRVSKFDNSLSFGAKQSSLRQIFFEL